MTTTANYNLNKPAFNSLAWHTPLNENMDLIDALFTSLFGAFPAFEGGWLNSTSYSENDIVVDLTTGTFYIVDVAHTSASSGTTFAEDRAANPTYWSVYNFGQSGVSWPSGLTSGDLIYFSGGEVQRLAIGSNDEFLRVVSGAPDWVSFTAAMISNSTSVGRDLLTAADEDAALDALGITAFAQTLLDDADAATARTTLGIDDGVITTRGDIIRGDASGDAERLAIGTNGQVLTSDGTDVGWDDLPSSGTLTGEVRMYGGAAAPSGWLLCQGQAVSRTTYSDLFSAISTTFGVGDGSTTFNLPDLRGRSPIGVGQSGGSGTNRVLGTVGGAETHTLTTAELAAHAHAAGSLSGTAASAGAHSHNLPWETDDLAPGTEGGQPSYPHTVGTQLTTESGGAHTHSVTMAGSTANAGSGSAHANMHPWAALTFIIKT